MKNPKYVWSTCFSDSSLLEREFLLISIWNIFSCILWPFPSFLVVWPSEKSGSFCLSPQLSSRRDQLDPLLAFSLLGWRNAVFSACPHALQPLSYNSDLLLDYLKLFCYCFCTKGPLTGHRTPDLALSATEKGVTFLLATLLLMLWIMQWTLTGARACCWCMFNFLFARTPCIFLCKASPYLCSACSEAWNISIPGEGLLVSFVELLSVHFSNLLKYLLMAALPFNLLTIVFHLESSRCLGFTPSHCPDRWQRH